MMLIMMKGGENKMSNEMKIRVAVSGHSYEPDEGEYIYASKTEVRGDYGDETIGFYDTEEEAEEAIRQVMAERPELSY